MESFSGRGSRNPVSREPAAGHRPSQTVAPAYEPAPVERESHSRPAATPPKKSGKKRLLLPLIIAAALIVLWLGVSAYNGLNQSKLIDGGKYQAVFLTNGQVYFGKLTRVNGDTYRLNKIFYLQATQTATEQDAKNPQKTDAANSNVQLIKLGSEVHGPEDQMIIDKSQVLFYENLTKEGKVVQSIEKYYSEKK
ncbi:MAG: hypothetical protein WAQ25_03765 [Candidatus Saccharimonas sp.]